MARAGVADLDGYSDLLARDGALLDDLIEELTVPETYFFREPAQFEFLRKVALPEISGRKEPGQTIRAWSAGCCSGEEAYSLAMLFAEEGLSGRSHVLATDIARERWRRRGGAVRQMVAPRRRCGQAQRHLRRSEGGYEVEHAIRAAVTFEHLNLALDVYPSYASGACGMDLILCRNVLIYLDPETIHEVAVRLHATLADGGWLVTASSDPPLTSAAPFEVVAVEEGVFYRRALAPRRTGPGPAGLRRARVRRFLVSAGHDAARVRRVCDRSLERGDRARPGGRAGRPGPRRLRPCGRASPVASRIAGGRRLVCPGPGQPRLPRGGTGVRRGVGAASALGRVALPARCALARPRARGRGGPRRPADAVPRPISGHPPLCPGLDPAEAGRPCRGPTLVP